MGQCWPFGASKRFCSFYDRFSAVSEKARWTDDRDPLMEVLLACALKECARARESPDMLPITLMLVLEKKSQFYLDEFLITNFCSRSFNQSLHSRLTTMYAE